MTKRFSVEFDRYDPHECASIGWGYVEDFDTLDEAYKKYDEILNTYYNSNWEYDEKDDSFYRVSVYDRKTCDYIVDSLEDICFKDKEICKHIKQIIYEN